MDYIKYFFKNNKFLFNDYEQYTNTKSNNEKIKKIKLCIKKYR